jgi:hypothetical protein
MIQRDGESEIGEGGEVFGGREVEVRLWRQELRLRAAQWWLTLPRIDMGRIDVKREGSAWGQGCKAAHGKASQQGHTEKKSRESPINN